MIQTSYDPEADVLLVSVGADGTVHDGAREVAPDVYVECEANGAPIRVEIIG